MRQEDLFYEVVVPPDKRPVRLDVFLTQQIASVSRARVQKVIEQGKVLVDGKPAKASHLIAPLQKIEVCIPKPVEIDLISENIPLDIVYEDDVLLVVNKPAGMVVHPAVGNFSGTLVNALLYHCRDLSEISGEKRPGIVHRLDKDTSGLLVVAKNDLAHRELSRQFKEKSIQRTYEAIVWWLPERRQGTIHTYIARSQKDRKRMSVQSEGKEAVTHYKVVERFDFLSLMQLSLETGRTHQIRVHLSYSGHPVFGDTIYNGRNRQIGGLTSAQRQLASELLTSMLRQALHAKSLGFRHPVTGDMLQFDSILPDDMQQLLNRLRTEKA